MRKLWPADYTMWMWLNWLLLTGTCANVGILMVTALDQPTDIERAVEVGTDDFVTRPINKTELLLRVRALLSAIPEPTPTDRTLAYFRRVQHGTLS